VFHFYLVLTECGFGGLKKFGKKNPDQCH